MAELPFLLLDTPRAGEGVNHRYFIAALDRCSETTATKFGTAARDRLIGEDYVAAKIRVAQITDRNRREGDELLILCGISRPSQPFAEEVQALLQRYLDQWKNDPIQPDGPEKGLCFSASALIKPEGAITAEVSRLKQAHSGRGFFPRIGRILRRAAVILLAIVAAFVFVWGGFRMLDRGGKSDPWDYLETGQWPRLATLTGLPRESNKEARARWALALLRETNPRVAKLATMDSAAGELRNDPGVSTVLTALEKAGPQATPAQLSLKWIELMNGETGELAARVKSLTRFADAVATSNPQNRIENTALVVRTWQDALLRFAKSPGNSKPVLRDELRLAETDLKGLTSTADASPFSFHPDFLTPADAERWAAIERFLDGDGFSQVMESLAFAQDWRSKAWPERLPILQQASKSGNLFAEFQRLIDALTNAVDTSSAKANPPGK